METEATTKRMQTDYADTIHDISASLYRTPEMDMMGDNNHKKRKTFSIRSK